MVHLAPFLTHSTFRTKFGCVSHPLRIPSALAPLALRLARICIIATFAVAVGIVPGTTYSTYIYMSKRSLFWGQATGKLGEAVYYRAGGEQRTRAWVAKIKNPRTRAQMRNRMTMHTLTTFFRAGAVYLRESFTNRKQNQSGFNAFVQQSKSPASGVVDEQALKNGFSFPAGYAIARGSAVFAPSLQPIVGTLGPNVEAPLGLIKESAGVFSNYADGIQRGTTTAHAKQILQSFFLANGAWLAGVPRVFKLNLCMSIFTGTGYRTEWRQLTVDGSQITDFTDELDVVTHLNVTGSIEPLGAYSFLSFIGDANGKVSLVMGMANETQSQENLFAFGGAFISFKDENGALVTSSADMAWLDGTTDVPAYSNYVEGGQVYEQVLEAYKYSSEGVLTTE